MKCVTITYPYNQGDHDIYLLSSYVDLLEYFDMVHIGATKYLKRLLSSKVSPDRWDHMISKSPEGNIMSSSLIDCKVNGGNPLFLYDKHLNRYQLNLVNHILVKGNTLAVNKVGGYFVWDEVSYPIVKEWKLFPEKEDTYKIVPNCKYINFENDESLEQHTIDFMSSKGYDEFSYICNLYQYSKKDLIEILKKFVSVGGETVYVYTTGINTEQIYEYTEAALNSGLDSFIFQFNSGTSESIMEVLNHLQNKSKVKWEFL